MKIDRLALKKFLNYCSCYFYSILYFGKDVFLNCLKLQLSHSLDVNEPQFVRLVPTIIAQPIITFICFGFKQAACVIFNSLLIGFIKNKRSVEDVNSRLYFSLTKLNHLF